LVFSQKRGKYSLETTFVLRHFKILSAILPRPQKLEK
jgi:hypothetical protein